MLEEVLSCAYRIMEEESSVRKLLKEWGLEESVIDNFIAGEMDLFALRHIDTEVVKELIPVPGQRIRFRARHSEWLKSLDKVEELSPAVVISFADDNGNTVIVEPNALEQEVEQIPSITPPQSEVEPVEQVPKKQKTYDLMTLLQSNPKGQKVKAMYAKSNSQLNDYSRQLLADIIVSDELEDDVSKSLTRDRFTFLSSEIVKCFPSEKQETWYESFINPKTSKTTIRGKLVWRYYNARRDYAKCGLMAKTKRNQPSSEVMTGGEVDGADLEALNGSILWLKENRQPWTQVTELWKKTSTVRLHQLKTDAESKVYTYVKDYPALEEPLGYHLFEIDFDQQYPDSAMSLFNQWNNLSTFIVNNVREKTPDFLQDAVYTPKEQLLKTLLSVSSLFPVVTVSKKKKASKNERKQWRPSKTEAQDAFLLNVPTLPMLHEHLDSRRAALESFGLTLQPLAAIIGPPEEPIQCLVIVDRFFYEVQSPLKAVDVVFKTFFALNTDYPPEAEQIWLFLQKCIYKINTHHDKKFSGVTTLAGKFCSK